MPWSTNDDTEGVFLGDPTVVPPGCEQPSSISNFVPSREDTVCPFSARTIVLRDSVAWLYAADMLAATGDEGAGPYYYQRVGDAPHDNPVRALLRSRSANLNHWAGYHTYGFRRWGHESIDRAVVLENRDRMAPMTLFVRAALGLARTGVSVLASRFQWRPTGHRDFFADLHRRFFDDALLLRFADVPHATWSAYAVDPVLTVRGRWMRNWDALVDMWLSPGTNCGASDVQSALTNGLLTLVWTIVHEACHTTWSRYYGAPSGASNQFEGTDFRRYSAIGVGGQTLPRISELPFEGLTWAHDLPGPGAKAITGHWVCEWCGAAAAGAVMGLRLGGGATDPEVDVGIAWMLDDAHGEAVNRGEAYRPGVF